MPVVHRLGERVGDAGAHSDQCRLLDAELGRDLVGRTEADAADVAGQAIGVLRNELNVRPREAGEGEADPIRSLRSVRTLTARVPSTGRPWIRQRVLVGSRARVVWARPEARTRYGLHGVPSCGG